MFLQNTSSSRRQKESKTACEFFSSFYLRTSNPHRPHLRRSLKGKKVKDKRDTGATISSLGKQQERLQLLLLPIDRNVCRAPKVVLKPFISFFSKDHFDLLVKSLTDSFPTCQDLISKGPFRFESESQSTIAPMCLCCERLRLLGLKLLVYVPLSY